MVHTVTRTDDDLDTNAIGNEIRRSLDTLDHTLVDAGIDGDQRYELQRRFLENAVEIAIERFRRRLMVIVDPED